MSNITASVFAVLVHIITPGQQEVIKQVGPEYDTAAACNASYLALEFSPTKPEGYSYECLGVDMNGNFIRPRMDSVVIVRPPVLGRSPDIVIQSIQ